MVNICPLIMLFVTSTATPVPSQAVPPAFSSQKVTPPVGLAPKAMGSALEEASRATSAERERGAEEGDWFAPRAEPSLWRLVKGNLGFLRPEGPAAP